MTQFAAQTDVPSERSRAEIDKTLARYKATGFMYGWSEQGAVIAFEMNGRRIRFDLTLPARNSKEFQRTPGRGLMRSSAQIEAAYEQAVRQRWRALALVIKAKLEAVESGISVFEEEFLANIVMPNNQKVGQWMIPQIAQAYASGKMPPMLPKPN